MTWFDIVIILMIAGSTYFSFRHGFIMELAYSGGFFVGLLMAFLLYPTLTGFFESILEDHLYGATTAFLVVFLITGGVISIGGLLMQNFAWTIKLKGLDRALGGLAGLLKAVVGVAVLVVIIGGLEAENPPSFLKNSYLCQNLISRTSSIMDGMPSLFETFNKDYSEEAMKWIKELREEQAEEEG